MKLAFQLANIAVFVQHAKSFQKPKDAVKSIGIGFLINALLMIMVCLGLMTICMRPEMADTPCSNAAYGAEWCRSIEVSEGRWSSCKIFLPKK